MRVLLLAPDDPRGSTHRLARLLCAHGIADARVVLLNEPPETHDRVDVARIHDGGRELETLLRGADVVHLVDLVPDRVPLVQDLPKRPRCVMQWSRPPTAAERRSIGDALAAGGQLLATAPGMLADPSVPFLPPLVNTDRAPWCPLLPGTRTRSRAEQIRAFASSPAAGALDPALERLVEAAEDLGRDHPDLRVEVFTGRPPQAAAQRQRRAHLVLAAATHGLPTTALEGLAQGLPVVVDTGALHPDAYARLAGGVAPPIFAPADVAVAVGEVRPMEDPDLALRAWAECAVDPRRWLAFCSRTYAELARAATVRRAA